MARSSCPAGTCLGVGVGGLTLGGGIGYNTHWGGLTCDHLRSTRIVTAAGEWCSTWPPRSTVTCSGRARAGPGGNFGMNTQFTFHLPEMPRQKVAFYRFDWRGADAATAVLSTHLTMSSPEMPGGFNAVAQAQACRLGPEGPREAITCSPAVSTSAPSGELETWCAADRRGRDPVRTRC